MRFYDNLNLLRSASKKRITRLRLIMDCRVASNLRTIELPLVCSTRVSLTLSVLIDLLIADQRVISYKRVITRTLP